MTECKRCSRKCVLFICSTCTENLRQQLHDLPWWLDRLMETAVGQVKLSDTGRRAKRSSTLHGDDSLASHIEAFRGCKCAEGACDCDPKKARRARERDALVHALAAGRSNAKASDELQTIHNTLTHWIQDICETRGVDTPTLKTPTGMARWLAKHVHSVAGQEDADRCCEDVALIVKNVERIVNRPVPPRFIGPCITDPAPEEVLAKRKGHNTRCGHELTANRKATEVTCPTCKQTYGVDQLINELFAESGDKLMTIRELVDWVLPRLDEPVPERTLYRWIKSGALPVGGHNERDESMVRLADVLEIRRAKPRHQAS